MTSEVLKKPTAINATSGDAQRSDHEDGHTDDEARKAKTKEKRGHRRVDTKGVVTYKRVRGFTHTLEVLSFSRP